VPATKAKVLALTEWKKNLAIMWLAQLIGMGAITGVVSFIPLYIPQLGITRLAEIEIWSGILMGVAPLFAGLAGPYWGAIADRKGRKPLVERVMLMFGCVMIGMAFVSDIYQLLALRIVQGIFGGFTASALALVASMTPKSEIGFAMGLFQTAMIAGGAVGPMFGGLVADSLGYEYSFAAFGLLCFIALVIIHFAVTERFTPAPQTDKPSIGSEITDILAIPGLKSMLVVQFLIQFSLQIIAPIMALYVKEMVPDTPYLASICGTIIAIAGVTSAIAAAGAGKLTRRYRNRDILVVAASIGAFFFAWQALAPSVLAFGILRGLSGFCLGAMLPASNTIITFLIPRAKQGVAYGVTTGAVQLGNVIGPLSGGAIALTLGIPSVFWVTAFLFAVVAVWVNRRIKEPGTGGEQCQAAPVPGVK
jgi:DHA1 family multidrug resistance protein-like MFS transporter